VFVRAPSWLGDFVMAEPLLRALHERVGEGLAIAGHVRFLDLLHGPLEAVSRLERADVGELRAGDFDLALLLDGSWRSAWIVRRAGIGERVGLARGGRAALLTCALRPARERGAAAVGRGRTSRPPRWLPRPFDGVCAELGSLVGVEVRGRPRLTPTPSTLDAARERLAALGLVPGEPYLLLNAAARAGSAKGLPPSFWEGLLPRLKGLPRALVLGAPGESGPARHLAAKAGALALVDPPPDLGELAALCAGAVCVVTADGGALHVARAVGAAAVVLFGPTDPRHLALAPERTRAQRLELACSPCHLERCPLDPPARHACMSAHDPARAAAGVRELIGTSATRAVASSSPRA
jgi:ADP-heptose:LPS heptosyltransferase